MGLRSVDVAAPPPSSSWFATWRVAETTLLQGSPRKACRTAVRINTISNRAAEQLRTKELKMKQLL
jgi:hypothetical protein